MSESHNTVYIGSTTDLRRRKYNHASASLHAPSEVYKYIRANGGFDNFDLFEIERVELMGLETVGINKKELYEREKHHIKEMRNNGFVVLNKNIPNRNCAEYYQDNKIDITNRTKTYRINNRPMVLQKKNQRITCACGVQYNNSNKVNHCKTQRHLNFTRLSNPEIIDDVQPSETNVTADVASAVLI